MVQMKILFLDFDGVLNGDRPTGVQSDPGFIAAWKARRPPSSFNRPHHPHLSPDPANQLKDLDTGKVALLNRIVAESGCKVVVSSTWRKFFDRAELQWLLEGAGFVGEVIGVTEVMTVPNRKFSDYRTVERGEEVAKYIKDHAPEAIFVVVDDDYDVGPVKDRWVRTDGHEGLTSVEVEEILALFGEKVGG